MECTNSKGLSVWRYYLALFLLLPPWLSVMLPFHMTKKFILHLKSRITSQPKQEENLEPLMDFNDSETSAYIDGLSMEYKIGWLNKCLYNPVPDCDQFPL